MNDTYGGVQGLVFENGGTVIMGSYVAHVVGLEYFIDGKIYAINPVDGNLDTSIFTNGIFSETTPPLSNLYIDNLGRLLGAGVANFDLVSKTADFYVSRLK